MARRVPREQATYETTLTTSSRIGGGTMLMLPRRERWQSDGVRSDSRNWTAPHFTAWAGMKTIQFLKSVGCHFCKGARPKDQLVCLGTCIMQYRAPTSARRVLISCGLPSSTGIAVKNRPTRHGAAMNWSAPTCPHIPIIDSVSSGEAGAHLRTERRLTLATVVSTRLFSCIRSSTLNQGMRMGAKMQPP